MEKPLVTLLLPCYNCEKTLDRFMRSVISESYHPLELICIDDGSTDDTAKLLKKLRDDFKRKRRAVYCVDAGKHRAWRCDTNGVTPRAR